MTALLEEGASYQEWRQACDALNKVQFTIEDAETGFGIIRRVDADPADMNAFLVRFQDVSPEIVLSSLTARWNLVAEAQDCGVDLKASSPNIYARMLTGPLTPEDFNIFPGFMDAEA